MLLENEGRPQLVIEDLCYRVVTCWLRIFKYFCRANYIAVEKCYNYQLMTGVSFLNASYKRRTHCQQKTETFNHCDFCISPFFAQFPKIFVKKGLKMKNVGR